jgi:hypothetical protein
MAKLIDGNLGENASFFKSLPIRIATKSTKRHENDQAAALVMRYFLI